MRISDFVLKGVVFLGHSGVHATPDDPDFVADGTGFVVVMQAYDGAYPYIVTAKHVLDQAAGVDEPLKEILIRVNLKAGSIKYVKTKLGQWHTHPDHIQEGRGRKYIDVAALGLVSSRTRKVIDDYRKWDFSFFLEEEFCTEEMIKEYNIGLGDELVIPGLFLAHLGTERNVPVLRTGTIASMRGEPVPTSQGLADAYLAEMRSVGGISGSPVYLHMAVRPETMYPGSDLKAKLEKAPKYHYLFGMVQGHYTITTQDEWIFKTNQLVGDINAGIAVVIPASKIMETILQPSAFGDEAEMARREREADKLIAKARAVPDSAPRRSTSGEVASDDEANPRHLEDFKRLVDVAARKRPRGD